LIAGVSDVSDSKMFSGLMSRCTTPYDDHRMVATLRSARLGSAAMGYTRQRST
jgi:hypothetical protein